MKKILLVGILVFLPQFAFAGSQIFSTPGTYTFSVPSGITSLSIELNGAGGGNGWGVAGAGGKTSGALAVTPGSPLTLIVGQSGSTGGSIGGGGSGASPWGGSGGGRSAVRDSSGTELMTAGGGGGGYWYSGYMWTGYGGAGGGTSGGNGQFGPYCTGGGGTQSAGGSGCNTRVAGSQFQGGGTGGGTVAGGGGGWYGGGSGIGGGGGSGYCSGVGVSACTTTSGAGSAANNDGSITITWTDPPQPLQCTGTAQTFSTPGTYTRAVPTYSSMSVTVNGAGGGGGYGVSSVNGGPGGDSSFNGTLVGGGGGGGARGWITNGANGSPGIATGGDTNTSGGGAAGGIGGRCGPDCPYGGNGGAGGSAQKSYASGSLTPGSTVSIVVGAGGTSGGGSATAGSNGSVTVTCSTNSAPTTPTISGPTSGFTKTDYTYTFTSTDPDSDTIRYAIDWNDNGTIDEYAPALGYVSSGTTGSTMHSWNSSNTQTFKVRTQDSEGNLSGWASYTINMSPNPPTVLLTATPSSITNGESSTLAWSSENANSCTGTNFSTGDETSGTVVVSPTVTTAYTVTCDGAGGQEASDSAEVTVSCTPTLSCTNSTTLHSTCPLPSGTDTSCASGQACSVNACEDTYSCLDTHTIVNNYTGATTNCPAPLICSSGSSTCVPAAEVQVIDALEARPSLVLEGDTTFLFWDIDNADESTCSVTGSDGTTVSTGASSSGQDGVETGYVESQTVFTLSCTGNDGALFTDSVTVNVIPLWVEF